MSKMIKNIFILISFFVWIFLSAQASFAQNKSGSTKPPSQVTIWYESLRDYIKTKISGEEKKTPAPLAKPIKVSSDLSVASKDNTVASKDNTIVSSDISAASEDMTVASVDATVASADATISVDNTNAAAVKAATELQAKYSHYYSLKPASDDVKDAKSKQGFSYRLQQQKEALSILAFEKLTVPSELKIERRKKILKEIKRIKDEVGLNPKEPITAQLMDPKSKKFNPKYYYLRKAISYYSKRTILNALEFNNRVLEGKVFMQDMQGFEKEFHSLFRKDFRNSLPAFDAEAKEFLGITTVRGLRISREGSLKQKMLNTMVNKKDGKNFAEWVDRVDLHYPRYLTQLMTDHSYKEIDWLYKNMQKTTQSNQLISYTAVIGLVWIFGQMNLDKTRLSYAELAVKKIICSRTELPSVPNLSLLPFDTRCP